MITYVLIFNMFIVQYFPVESRDKNKFVGSRHVAKEHEGNCPKLPSCSTSKIYLTNFFDFICDYSVLSECHNWSINQKKILLTLQHRFVWRDAACDYDG